MYAGWENKEWACKSLLQLCFPVYIHNKILDSAVICAEMQNTSFLAVVSVFICSHGSAVIRAEIFISMPHMERHCQLRTTLIFLTLVNNGVN